MVSMIPLSILLHVTLFLLLIQITLTAPIPPPKKNTYIVHADHLAKPSRFATHELWYNSMVATHRDSRRAEATSSSGIMHVYDTVMHGFAVQLTGDEAQRISSAPGVTGVHEDKVLNYLTTRSPGFLGLDPSFGAWNDTDMGDGVIIGFIDSGIWPESASFNDTGLGPVRQSWRGGCVNANDFNASLCNNKLVGAKAFAAGFPSPRDLLGHGTHVASTAAGSAVRDIGFLKCVGGTARGVAPKARIAMYMVGVTAPSEAAVVAAIDTAVKDGVDIISLSLGLKRASFSEDSLAIAAFGAERHGVFVVLAGGNGGPNASTVINVAPWMTTVGASTVDRVFPGRQIQGQGATAIGQGQSLQNDTCETVIGENRAPMVAAFSSRGPNPIVPELLKPDIIAPGKDIIAAWKGDYAMESGTSMACPHVAGAAALIKKKHSDWTPAMIRSALITTAATLDNTDRQILDNGFVDGSRGAAAATPFATGAGQVRPQLATDPGLVYDAGVQDYIDFLCALNYTTEQLRRFAPDIAACARTLPGGPADLNYPSFVVIFRGGTDVRTLTRTVTKVSEKPNEMYNVTVVAPANVKVTVTPASLEFKQPYEKKSYSVEFRSDVAGNRKPDWGFGYISWENMEYRVRSPVAFMWD